MAAWSIFVLLVGIILVLAGLFIIGMNVTKNADWFTGAKLWSSVMIILGLVILLFGSRGCYSFDCNLNNAEGAFNVIPT